MDARQIRKLQAMLNKCLAQFDDCFSRSEPGDNLRVYVNGQLSDLPGKSIEPIADRACRPPRTLQQFMSRSGWDDALMADRLVQIVARDHGHPMSIGVIDETGDPKKGDKTPGVQRQYCGATGKVDNCVVTVHLSYVAGDFHTLLAGELFLPPGVVGRSGALPRGRHPGLDGPPGQVADCPGAARLGGGQRRSVRVGDRRRGLWRGAGVPVRPG